MERDTSQRLAFGRYTLVPLNRELHVDGVPIELGGRAFDVLLALIEAGGLILSKDELMSRVWPGRVVEENNLQVQIAALRKAFGDDRELIRTVAGRGYQFTGKVELATAGITDEPLPRTNLPESISELIGRQAELAEIVALVRASRMVTLTGTGGIGKTRLSLEVGRRLLAEFAGGVWIAELAPLSDPDLVPVTVAGALGLTVTSHALSFESIAAGLGARPLLLILDNCEHVIDMAARTAEMLLRASTGARVIATGREPLRAPGEHVYRVPALEVPAESGQTTEELLRSDAVRLFVSRARSTEPEFALDAHAAVVAAAICRRLDGIPLAIELAAARVGALGVDAVADRLDDRFKLLTGGHRTALPRHQTLRAALDWSYELLSDPERVVLARLAVFAGGFTIEAACAASQSDQLAPNDVVDCVLNLVAKSLITANVSRPIADYRLLETTRAYGLEKLTQSGELAALARRHAEYYCEYFQRIEPEWDAELSAEWLAVHSREIDNVRAALDWAYWPGGDSSIAVALTVAVIPLWFRLSLMDECLRRVRQAIASVDAGARADARQRMKLHTALGSSLLYLKGVVPETGAAWARAYELADGLGDDEYRLRALWGVWAYRYMTGSSRSALETAERFSELSAGSDDGVRSVADRLMGVSLHYLGDQSSARSHLERMLAHYPAQVRRLHTIRFVYDQPVLARVLLAQVLWLQGFPEQALHEARAGVADALAINHLPSICHALGEGACAVAIFRGDLAEMEYSSNQLMEYAATQISGAWHAWGLCVQGLLLIKRGDADAYNRVVRPAFDELAEARFGFHYTGMLAALADALGKVGRLTEGLASIDEALARTALKGERWSMAELMRVKGELLLLEAGPGADAAAEQHFTESLEWARKQAVLSWELRAAMSLARFWHQRGKGREARELLAAVYERFTEGFETPDLVAATALLEAL